MPTVYRLNVLREYANDAAHCNFPILTVSKLET